MADWYIRVDHQGNPKTHVAASSVSSPLTQPHGLKDYYVPATLVEESVTIGKYRGSVVYDVANGTITYPALDLQPTANDIRAEARRRILAVYPDWKQANMLARASELHEKRLAGNELTAEEVTERDALQAAWTWIKSIRAASDALELTLPADYRADSHWS